MTELLAPAGGWEALMAAVACGADAVYLGGSAFNARASADNFTDIRQVVDYCAARDVRVYLTLNTLVKEEESEAALQLAREAAQAGVNALILQDVGLAGMIRANCDIPLHASTQLCTHNTEAIPLLKEWGFSRAILARETSLDEARRIIGMEVEMFVHGALCVGFSGQCLMSSVIGGRSGNRGRCAQPCRLPWKLTDRELTADGYRLNTRDICNAYDLKDFVDAGIASLKIEGRLKRPEYVAVAVSVYRKALDAALEGKKCPLTQEDMQQLKLAFHRGGFSKGYAYDRDALSLMDAARPNHGGVYAGKVLKGMRVEQVLPDRPGDAYQLRDANGNGDKGGILSDKNGIRLPKHAAVGDTLWKTTDACQREWAQARIKEGKLLPVRITAKGNIGAPLAVSVENGSCGGTGYSDIPLQSASGRPLEREDVLRRLQKLGDTPYRAVEVKLELDDNAFLPVGQIALAKRRAAELLQAELRTRNAPAHEWKPVPQATCDNGVPNAERPMIVVQATTAAQVKAAVENGADAVVLAPKQWNETVLAEMADAANEVPAALYLPPVTFDKDIELAKQLWHGAVYANGIGALNAFKDAAVFGGEGLNVMNSRSLLRFAQLGARRITLSPELTLNEAQRLFQYGNCELIAYGRLPLMNLVHCPRRAAGAECDGKHCVSDRMYPIMEDRMRQRFLLKKVHMSACLNQLLNAHVLHLLPYAGKIKDAAAWRLIFTEETPEETAQAVAAYAKAAQGINCSWEGRQDVQYTAGHALRGVE